MKPSISLVPSQEWGGLSLRLHLSLSVVIPTVLVLIGSLLFWKIRVYSHNQFRGLRSSSIHDWKPFQQSSTPCYCLICRQLISGFWIFRNTGWQCVICTRTVHLKCIAACQNLQCKTPCSTHPLIHQFTLGNLPTNSLCSVCGVTCSSNFGLVGTRCLWCNRTLHEECVSYLPEICDLGPYRDLILPPYCVKLQLQSDILSAFSSKYINAMGSHLRESLQQVQAAMSVGLKERLKGVSEGMQRLNEAVKLQIERTLSGTRPFGRKNTMTDFNEPKPIAAPFQYPQYRSYFSNSRHKKKKYKLRSFSFSNVTLTIKKVSKFMLSNPYPLRFVKRRQNYYVVDPPLFCGTGYHGVYKRYEPKGKYTINFKRPLILCRAKDVKGIMTSVMAQSNHHFKKISECEDGKMCMATSPSYISHGEYQSTNVFELQTPLSLDESVSSNFKSTSEMEFEKSVETEMFNLAKYISPKADLWVLKNTSNFFPNPLDPSKTSCDTLLSSVIPLLAFVNLKSGGQSGYMLFKELITLLNPIQVVDIQTEKGAYKALQRFLPLARLNCLRILICGGDGTVGWVVQDMLNILGESLAKACPIAIIPLGTGNDLSHILGWGMSLEPKIEKYLYKILSARIASNDVWKIEACDSSGKSIYSRIFLNYMDIGVAARVAMRFHQLRETYPEVFKTRIGNKFLYGEVGLREFLGKPTFDISGLKIRCDGNEISLPDGQIEGICVVNIPSFSGGLDLWRFPKDENKIAGVSENFNMKLIKKQGEFSHDGIHPFDKLNFSVLQSAFRQPFFRHLNVASKLRFETSESNSNTCNFDLSKNKKFVSKNGNSPSVSMLSSQDNLKTISSNNSFTQHTWKKQSTNDQIIEVVLFRNIFHLGQIQVGLAEPIRICQGRHIEIDCPNLAPIQIDGEPFLITPCTLNITYATEMTFLKPLSTFSTDFDIFFKALDKAANDNIITWNQRNQILKCMSTESV